MAVIDRILIRNGIRLKIGIQSNGLLLNQPICDFLVSSGISIGISIDGPPPVNDLYRVDRLGRGTTAKLESKLQLLFQPRYRPAFGGFLCVINTEANPVDTFRYLASFEDAPIDFILPYDNHDRLPVGKTGIEGPTPYADWLISIFDIWTSERLTNRIRLFDSILQMLFGGQSLVESVGEDPTDIVVVETDGSLEAVDSLKATYQGATKVGLNVFLDTFDAFQARTMGMIGGPAPNRLCTECQLCSVRMICGGYLPHRYSSKNGFDNPSIYCHDLQKLIRHIHAYAKQHTSVVTR